MATISRIRVPWSGAATTGPGLSTFYMTETFENPGAIKAFFTAIQAYFNTATIWTIPNSGDVLDVATGALTGTWVSTGGGSVTGSTTGAYVQGAGSRVVWATGGIVAGRRVKGSTFLTSVMSINFTSSGAPTSAMATAVNAAAGTLLTSTSPYLGIYSRPQGIRPGAFSPVVAGSMPLSASWLRSRRT